MPWTLIIDKDKTPSWDKGFLMFLFIGEASNSCSEHYFNAYASDCTTALTVESPILNIYSAMWYIAGFWKYNKGKTVWTWKPPSLITRVDITCNFFIYFLDSASSIAKKCNPYLYVWPWFSDINKSKARKHMIRPFFFHAWERRSENRMCLSSCGPPSCRWVWRRTITLFHVTFR
jgi:hypothetical protein